MKKKGIGNLTKHIENIKKFGLPCIVAINAFPTDTEAELKLLDDMCKELNVEVSISKYGLRVAKEALILLTSY